MIIKKSNYPCLFDSETDTDLKCKLCERLIRINRNDCSGKMKEINKISKKWYEKSQKQYKILKKIKEE